MDLEHRVKETRPKGGQCINCEKINNDCSGLDFEAMPIIAIGLDEVIVRCTEYKKRDNQFFDEFLNK